MKTTTQTLLKLKEEGKKIAMLTAYDYPTALLVDEAGADVILVGDSLGNVVLGYDNTTYVTMDDMVHHTKAVTRAVKNALVVADMPFLSYHQGIYESVKNAGRLVQEGGANAVKLEGGREIIDDIKAIIKAGIPVMGHIGLLPQSVNKIGGYFVQGKDEEAQNRMIEDAKALQDAGCFAIVIECVKKELGEKITRELKIPTIGIGAGVHCDGQVLVLHDMLGLYHKKAAKFVKQYAEVANIMQEAIKNYVSDVKSEKFPTDEHSF